MKKHNFYSTQRNNFKSLGNGLISLFIVQLAMSSDTELYYGSRFLGMMTYYELGTNKLYL